jgi:hypothetical protein
MSNNTRPQANLDRRETFSILDERTDCSGKRRLLRKNSSQQLAPSTRSERCHSSKSLRKD